MQHKLTKETLLEYIHAQASQLKLLSEALLKQQEINSNQLEAISNKMHRYTTIATKLVNEPQLQIKIQDYLSESEFQDYLASIAVPIMLCDFDTTFRDWLDWFYEEMPFIKSKHLTFFDTNINEFISITKIDMNMLIKVDHALKRIYLHKDQFESVIVVNLNGISLYEILNISYRSAKEQHLVNQFESGKSYEY